jgi:RimJ/RimL family protein N-acetyltransferase
MRPTPKPCAIKPGPPVAPELVRIVSTKGTAGRGGDAGGESWRIEVDGKRAGVVFINLIDEPPIGRHASIQIFLNATSQGRRIGRVAYRLACEASGAYDTIYAHMRKSNIASRRAAEEAGFTKAALPDQPQLIMVRQRQPRGA